MQPRENYLSIDGGAQVLPALIAAARSGNTSRLKQLLEGGSAPNQVAVSYLPHVDSGLSEQCKAGRETHRKFSVAL